MGEMGLSLNAVNFTHPGKSCRKSRQLLPGTENAAHFCGGIFPMHRLGTPYALPCLPPITQTKKPKNQKNETSIY
jgi:hypothetical protein